MTRCQRCTIEHHAEELQGGICVVCWRAIAEELEEKVAALTPGSNILEIDKDETDFQTWKRVSETNPNLAKVLELVQLKRNVVGRIQALVQEFLKVSSDLNFFKSTLSEEDRKSLNDPSPSIPA